ncbi:MAG: cytidine deaminase [Lachnospiraceae bacterium]|nr:cytidine deaminase [Lachnospiraceae bacterium]
MPDNINISVDIIKELIQAADKVRKKAYAPYSRFKVGAALYAVKNEEKYDIITGCNVENASYPAGNCAERTAVFKAVSEGYNSFKAIAIIGGYDEKMIQYNALDNQSDISVASDNYTSPCGICRQVIREFVTPNDFYVIMARSDNDYIIKTLEELMPMSFGPDNLN